MIWDHPHDPNRLPAWMRTSVLKIADLAGWARPRGGVDAEMVIAQMVLVGNRRDQVRILGMRAINQCGPPLTGTIFHAPSAGEDHTIRLAFNLDEPNPQARIWSGTAGFGGNYFDAKTISLKYKEQQAIQILGITQRQYCQFRIETKVFTKGRTETAIMANGREPFKVTALTSRTQTAAVPYADYQRAYVGGVNNTRDHGGFTKVNPATHKPSDLQKPP